MNHLFLFSIGPVQGFISQARKTIDLKNGSDILSKLILKGIKTAKDDYRAEIIFPYFRDGINAESMPNRFLARVSIEKGDLLNMGEMIELKVRSELLKMAENVVKDLRKNSIKEGQNFKEKFSDQIKNQLEVFWAFEPIDETVNDFQRAYSAVESNLGAIKNLRVFNQLPENENGRKCSVTGERDALIFNLPNDKSRLPAFVGEKNILALKLNSIQIEEGEGLSAPVALKRFHKDKSRKSFASVVDVTTLHFHNSMDKESKEKFNLYKSLFPNDYWDNQFLFEENLTQKKLEGILLKTTPQNLLKNYRNLINGRKVGKISSYYAFLTFDGDRMGATWSGDIEILKPQVDLSAFQQKLSEYLFDFSVEAKKLIDGTNKGVTVYAGGDDFSGFVNLDYLFDVLGGLRNLYREIVSEKLKEFLQDSAELNFSAGICIAHYKTPLSEVIKKAHAAQKDAKDKNGGNRNAFTIYLLKRSGEIQHATMKWGSNLENLNSIINIIENLKHGRFSNTFISVLHREVRSLIGRAGSRIDSNFQHSFNKIIIAEINRLIKRSFLTTGKHLDQDNQSNKTVLIEGLQNAVTHLFRLDEFRDKPENALYWLEVADFFQRELSTNENSN